MYIHILSNLDELVPSLDIVHNATNIYTSSTSCRGDGSHGASTCSGHHANPLQYTTKFSMSFLVSKDKFELSMATTQNLLKESYKIISVTNTTTVTK